MGSPEGPDVDLSNFTSFPSRYNTLQTGDLEAIGQHLDAPRDLDDYDPVFEHDYSVDALSNSNFTRGQSFAGRFGEIVSTKLPWKQIAIFGLLVIVATADQQQIESAPTHQSITPADACMPQAPPENLSDALIDIERCHQIVQNGGQYVPLLEATPGSTPQS